MGRGFIKRKPWGGSVSKHPIKGSTRDGLYCIDCLKWSTRLRMPDTWVAYKRTNCLSRNVPLNLPKLAQNRPKAKAVNRKGRNEARSLAQNRPVVGY